MEEKELAAAGYDKIEEQKAQQEKEGLAHVDVHEHTLPFDGLKEELKATFDPQSPGSSIGLTKAEAKARLEKNGPNILTPPKKKSALRKVSINRVRMRIVRA